MHSSSESLYQARWQPAVHVRLAQPPPLLFAAFTPFVLWRTWLTCRRWHHTPNPHNPQCVTLFLAWLNAALAQHSLLVVTSLFFGIGVTMFLLPPVPGVPVYLAGGVIVVNKARGVLGFWPAVGYTVAVCSLIKFLAIAIQQKGIGERMSGSVAVRKAVGVNSLSIRAIRLILESPGMDKRKVFILCGGPDWPISVLTGILRLPLSEMLKGSLPVVFLVGPCVCAGAFLLRTVSCCCCCCCCCCWRWRWRCWRCWRC